jgi:anti-sigma factor RsiW
MDHDELESLLGAYALDAVDPDEAQAIEEHLLTCPRCLAELSAYREVAAAIGNTGAEAPRDLWDRIAARLDAESPVPNAQALISSLPRPARRLRYRWPAALAAAVIAIVALSLQVANLDNQVHQRNGSQSQALASAVSTVLAQPHQTITLSSASSNYRGTIVVGREDGAYWVASNLPTLSSKETFQLWGLVRHKIVSLGLLGSDPKRFSAFRLQHGTRTVMVTIEPEGGTPAPTSNVVVAGTVPQLS